MDDAELQTLIRAELWASYQREAHHLRNRIRGEAKKEAVHDTEDLQNEIDVSREHDQIVNLCTRPFESRNSELRRLGYGFVRADPLYEIEGKNGKLPNFDFLICKPKASVPILIFGEVKSQITHYGKEFSDISSKIETVRGNLKVIMEDYLHFDKTDREPIIEYVLAFKSDITDLVLSNVAKYKFNVILWKVDIFDRKLSLVQEMKIDDFTPPKHADHDLDRILGSKNGGVVSRKFTESVFPQSHTLSKLRILIETIDLNSKPYVIEAESLRKKLLSHLHYLGEKAIDDEVSLIIEEGLKIGFIQKDKELPPSSYRVSSKAPRWEGLDKALEKKWILWKLKEKQDKGFENARLKLQNKYLAQNNQRPTLFSLAGMQEPPYSNRPA